MHGPCVRLRVQAVVHVDRAQAVRTQSGIACEHVQQNGRIESTAEADEDRGIGVVGWPRREHGGSLVPFRFPTRDDHERQAASYAPYPRMRL
jgi:hypothetical protein